jgi:SAM-dependent methyltransferase
VPVVTDEHHMGEFWDERAREDALYFVDDRMAYGAADEQAFWAGGAEAVDLILGELGVSLSGDETVVEIGCGVGRITRALAGQAERVLALDVSSRMLELAREHNPDLDNVTWVQGTGTDLSGIPDADADACFSHVVFQHIPDPQITLGYVREMGRVLKPGGWSAFQVSNAPAVHTPRRTGLRARLRRGPKGTGDPRWLGSAVALDELEAAAGDGGLKVERVMRAETQFCLVLLRC